MYLTPTQHIRRVFAPYSRGRKFKTRQGHNIFCWEINTWLMRQSLFNFDNIRYYKTNQTLTFNLKQLFHELTL